MSIFSINQLSPDEFQIVMNGKELCVVSSYDDEDHEASERASLILGALQYREESREKAFEDWMAKYEPEMSSSDNAVIRMYETYGTDLDEAKAAPSGHIWTVVDCDGDLWLTPGFHFVNRVNYVICRNPFDTANPPEDVYY